MDMKTASNAEVFTSRKLLDALTAITGLLLRGDDEREALIKAFENAANHISAGSVCLFERDRVSASRFRLAICWSDPGFGETVIPESLPADPSSRWLHLLGQGEAVLAGPGNRFGLGDSFGGNRTVVLIPLRSKQEPLAIACVIFGESVVVNDDLFGAAKALFCCIGAHMQNRTIETALSESEVRYNQIFRANPAVKFLIDPDTGRIVDANHAACLFYGYTYRQLIARKISDINILPAPEVKARIDEAMESGGALFQFNHRKSNGEIREVEVYTAPVQLNGRKLLYSIIHDVTDRMLAQEQLRFGEMLFRQFVYSTPAAVAMFDTNLNYLLTSKRWVEDFRLGSTPLHDMTLYDTFPGIPAGWTEVLEPALAGQTASSEEELMSLPDGSREWIRWEIQPWYQKQDTIGGIIIYTELITERKKAAETEKDLIRQRVRLAARLETIEEERRKISRELHDGLGQMITAAVLNVQLLENSISTEPAKATGYAETAKSLLDTTIQEVRNISQALRPSILDDFGLIPALRLLCEDFSKFSGTGISFESFGIDERLPSGLEISIYRICQEAISNIVRHSGATEAGIQLYRRTNTLLLLIEDNGKGIEQHALPGDLSRTGSGLTNIRERAELHNGRLQIESQPGGGLELIVEIPLG